MKKTLKYCSTLLGLLATLLATTLLSGCATAGQGTLPSRGAMTMSAIYARQTHASEPQPRTVIRSDQ